MEDLEVQIRDITEEKHEAERSRSYLVEQLEACEQFRGAIDAAPLGIVIADESLSIVYQNASSESGFAQLSSFLSWNSDVVIGRPLAALFPDDAAALTILSDPDRLPHEEMISVGPYHLRYLAWPVYSSEDEYIGPMLLWEVEEASEQSSVEASTQVAEDIALVEGIAGVEPDDLGDISPEDIEIFQEEITEQPDLESEEDVEFGGKFERGLALVSRSVRLISERLSTIRSMVEALCNEGDNLQNSLEDTRQRTQHITYMTSERSEALWELVHESSGIEERTRASSMLIKRLRKHLTHTETISSGMTHLSDAIDHLVVEGRMEVGKTKEAGIGMKVILDEMRRISKEALKLDKDVKTKVGRVETDVDEILDLLEEDRREVRAGGRVSRRAENSLERIDRDLSDVDERTNLLVEMAVGQSEIGTHIAGQLTELTELIQITTRVALEQGRIVEDFMKRGEDTDVVVEEEL